MLLSPLWPSSAFLWTYDTWGGWYDHVRPPKGRRLPRPGAARQRLGAPPPRRPHAAGHDVGPAVHRGQLAPARAAPDRPPRPDVHRRLRLLGRSAAAGHPRARAHAPATRAGPAQRDLRRLRRCRDPGRRADRRRSARRAGPAAPAGAAAAASGGPGDDGPGDDARTPAGLVVAAALVAAVLGSAPAASAAAHAARGAAGPPRHPGRRLRPARAPVRQRRARARHAARPSPKERAHGGALLRARLRIPPRTVAPGAAHALRALGGCDADRGPARRRSASS